MGNKSQQEPDVDIWLTLKRQLMSFWELDKKEEDIIRESIPDALAQVQEAYDVSNRVYYKKYGFSILNTTVYAVFLYYLSHMVGCYGGGVKPQTNYII